MPFLVGMIRPWYRIDSFAYVDRRQDLVLGADPTGPGAAENFGCSYGCGIFELTKAARGEDGASPDPVRPA